MLATGDTKPTSFASLPAEAWTDQTPAVTDPPPATDTQTTETTDQPVAATTPPAEQASGEAPRDAGPIPFDRHKAILEAERVKRADVEAKWQRMQWAEPLLAAGKTPADVQQAMDLLDAMSANPIDFLSRYHDRLASHPEFGPQVKSWAGKVLGASQPSDDPEPQPDFQDAQGNRFYSADRQMQRDAWRERQLERRLSEQMAPLQQAYQRQTQTEQQTRLEQAAFQDVSAQLAEMRQKPYFKEHEADIKAYLASKDWRPSLEAAYVEVLTTKVLPTLQQTERASTIAALKTQAAASSAKPSATASATPGRYASFKDLPKEAWE